MSIRVSLLLRIQQRSMALRPHRFFRQLRIHQSSLTAHIPHSRQACMNASGKRLSSTVASKEISTGSRSRRSGSALIDSVDNSMRDRELEDKDGYLDNDADLDELDHQGDNDDPDPAYRIGKHLLKYSRVHYRHITHLPEWFIQKQAEIVNYRTPSQIRRCLQNWMIDKNDFELNKKILAKPLVWRDDDMNSSNAKNIKIYGADETVAYVHYHMPSRFSIARRIFDEMKLYLPSFKPERVIDYGCGPGTAGAALKDVYGENMKKYSGVDMSRSMLDSAKMMMEVFPDVSCTFWDKIGDLMKRVDRTQDRFDLGILAYTLTELTTDVAKRAAVQVMFELLDVNGCLVIIENGNPQGSHTVRTARQFILDNFPSKVSADSSTTSINLILPFAQYDRHEISARVVAPCTHDQACPLRPGVFCSFSQKVLSGMIRKGSEEKFSYVIIQKISTMPTIHASPSSKESLLWTSSSPQQAINSGVTAITDPTPRVVLQRFLRCDDYEQVTQLLDQLVDEVDWDEYRPPLYRHEWSRIIRSPIKAKGHIVLDACTPTGRIQRSTLSRGNVMNIPSLFVSIRKTTWGGLFPSDIEATSSKSEQQPYSPLTYLTKRRIEGEEHSFSVSKAADPQEKKTPPTQQIARRPLRRRVPSHK
jgi:ribosomal protein RSM22 (predicted rRNA methylase)